MTDLMYTRSYPFKAKILSRIPLSRENSSKETLHVVLDLQGSGIEYTVGDCLAVIPLNDPKEVDRFLRRLGTSGEELIVEKRTNELCTLASFLLEKANINDCTLKLLEEIKRRESDSNYKDVLEALAQDKGFQEIQLIDLLEGSTASFTSQELADFLKPMMPRFYSIASSKKVVGDEVHLTVALEKREKDGKCYLGVCTDFLCSRASLEEPVVPVYLHPHKGFTLPQDSDAHVIMVGPGTGVAPFRGFMQERETSLSFGRNWLFFGERHREHHFFYETYWRALEEKGILRLDTAFSRDQKEKVYVQDKMEMHGKELFEWFERGAYFYVCGDASRMAKDVDGALHRIIATHGRFSEEETKEYVKKLRSQKRYLRDVY